MLMEIWQRVNAWKLLPPWFQLPNIISKYFYISGATPPENVIYTSWIWLPFIQRYHLRRRFVSPFFFPHTPVKHPDARLQNCKACGPMNCWEGLINWGPFLTLGWDKILTPTWLFRYHKYCFFGKGTFFRTYSRCCFGKTYYLAQFFGGVKKNKGFRRICHVSGFDVLQVFRRFAWRERIDSCRSKTTLD